MELGDDLLEDELLLVDIGLPAAAGVAVCSRGAEVTLLCTSACSGMLSGQNSRAQQGKRIAVPASSPSLTRA